MDGSGKTTLARRLTERLRQQGYDTEYVHGILIHQSLLNLVKPIAQRLFMRGTDEQADYVQYRKVKTSASRRHPVLSGLYGAIYFFDYLLEAIRLVTIPVLARKMVVADRYIYDLVLNVALAIDRPYDSLAWLVNVFFLLNPRPDQVFVIDAPEEVAFSRKADVHAIEYLQERRSQYLALARRYGFRILDGQADPDELLDQVARYCLGDTPRTVDDALALRRPAE